MTKYIIVEWPESQKVSEHKRENECYPIMGEDDTYAVPEDLYEEIFNDSPIDSFVKDFEVYCWGRAIPNELSALREFFKKFLKRTGWDKRLK